MRNKATPEQIEQVIDLLKKAWEKYPEQRLGQLILNLCRQMHGTMHQTILWNMDEAAFIECLNDLLENGW